MLTKKLADEVAETVTSTTLADGETEADLVVTVAVSVTEASAETVTAALAVVTESAVSGGKLTRRPSETGLRLTKNLHRKMNFKEENLHFLLSLVNF